MDLLDALRGVAITLALTALFIWWLLARSRRRAGAGLASFDTTVIWRVLAIGIPATIVYWLSQQLGRH